MFCFRIFLVFDLGFVLGFVLMLVLGSDLALVLVDLGLFGWCKSCFGFRFGPWVEF